MGEKIVLTKIDYGIDRKLLQIKQGWWDRFETLCGVKDNVDISRLKQIHPFQGGIGPWAFQGLKGLEEADLSEVCFIAEGAFCDCKNLKKLKIGRQVYRINKYAFTNCTSLKELTIPSRVGFVGTRAFAGCSSLEKVTIESPNIEFMEGVFADCENLKTFEMSQNVLEGLALGAIGRSDIDIEIKK